MPSHPPAVGVSSALALLGSWTTYPAVAGLFTDFDGTLAPIVDDPSTSTPLPGAVDALDGLARRLGRVGVVSGRPVEVLARHFPDAVALSGLYGLQRRIEGRRIDDPEALAWAPTVADTVERARADGPPGVRVEDKELSLTLHFRERPELAGAVEAFAAAEAERSGLRVHDARMSVELHPPVTADKGTALTDLADGLSAACFVGDDVGDLPAFAALDELATSGVSVVKVAVSSGEQDPRVREAADVELDGAGEVVELFGALRAALDAAP